MANKKILHLICNSHIDPVWQWDWDEGMSFSLSTFYAACNLLDEYDFIFCHNEVIVYEYIEKYDPKLFKRIQELVKQGKWRIMGGWYLQPDCYVPSGESFMRQISLGREYFWEKFASRPKVALNFDSFGHTKGLPQILAKSGYDAYIFCRPLPIYVSLPNFKDYPHGPFLWEGYDGTRIKALRYEDEFCNYTTQPGKAVHFILKKEEQYKDIDIVPVLWGVGNHGGVASKSDLEDIMVLKDQKKGEWEIIHSTLEDYFNSVNPTQVEKRQIFVFSKSYSSVQDIKKSHDELENMLYLTEKVCSIASLAKGYNYNKEVLKNAERTLCAVEFHDVLAGTAIKSAMDASVRRAYAACEQLKDELFGAFYALGVDLPAAKPTYSNNVFMNPYPYDYDGLVECEIYPNVWPENCFTQEYDIKLYDMDGKVVPYQIIKEQSNIAVQHRVRLLFKAHIPAFSMVSFSSITTLKEKEAKKTGVVKEDVAFKDSVKEVVISKKTGLIKSFKMNGKEFLKGEASQLMFFNDNEDPWGWRLADLTTATFNENGWPQKEHKNTLSAMRLDGRHRGFAKDIDAISITEEGVHLTQVEALFYKGDSRIVVKYKLYKNTPYIDIDYHVLWNEGTKGLKVKFPLEGRRDYFAQMAFGIEKYKADGIENPSNRYVGVLNGDDAFVIYNRSGIHSVSKKGSNLYLTLLNGASYCAHPTLPELKLVPKGRFEVSCEQGVHDFALRLQVNKLEEVERFANEFNQPIYTVDFYPHGDEKGIFKDICRLSNKNVVISAFKKRKDDSYLIRLYNGSDKKVSTELSLLGKTIKVSLKKFEFKTFVYDGKKIVESLDSSIY